MWLFIKKRHSTRKNRILEHYESDNFHSETFDLITFDASKVPMWSSIDKREIMELLDCDSSEFIIPTNKDNRLLTEIEKLRNKIDPFMDFPLREDHKIINRRADIEASKIYKQVLVDVIEANSKENEIARVLKNDLSIFAEIYAHPEEEYICFSEFPIADGFVDFVVFSGRSRMDVTLIEVKGADFFLLNQGHYETFSRKVEEAASQLRERITYIYRNYDVFRSKVHRIREQVESGKSVYDSLLGPKGELLVDPNKNINIYPVLICGRTRDDIKESEKRHKYENGTHPTIKIETWDTMIRKLRRK